MSGRAGEQVVLQNEAHQKKMKELCQYINNTGQTPLRVDDFDDDWCPTGEMYRDMLFEDELITIDEPRPPTDDTDGQEGGIYLTPAGAALI